ncbi:hypothetical protein CFR79_07300 [Komagataeibacter saccharivorans]|nr:hypothetical protein CFR79_07300 [Komagataeibacter saccharivorans]GBQ43267.1 hypothetical protein AA0614_2892 [Komagataeibacter saccharivorans NRIC 0614]
MTAWASCFPHQGSSRYGRVGTLEELENGDFSGNTPASFVFAMSAEIAFIDFDLPFERPFQGIVPDDNLPTLTTG